MKHVRRIGILGFDGAEALDINGPFDVFATANAVGARVAYEPLVLAAGTLGFASESGLRFRAHARMDDAPPLDTAIVPGGSVLRAPNGCDAIVPWLAARARRTRRVVAVCTGTFALASAGLLDGRRATTHWRHADELARRWPSVRVESDAIYVKDGRFYTSAGITAGIDLALALVEEDLGAEIALAVARELVVYVKRSGGQLQYSDPLRFQTTATGPFAELVAWMREHLRDDLSIEALAERANLSARHFNRKFRATFGATPASFVEDLRLDEARWCLTQDASIERVAASVGYRSDDAFRRAFQRRFGVSPSDYRTHFPVSGDAPG